MSDPKRATLTTVCAPKSAKKSVTNTVRLTINLVESNESKYTEVNYNHLVRAEERKKKAELANSKTDGLDPFSDNDEDVERVAKKFEQKYGGNSTYGKKRTTTRDEFADIGAGYDENDSFIDNTDGYDEMIPPEYDTLYGGFYINSGSLAFKNVPENHLPESDSENVGTARNKRRISSSSSESRSSDSSSESSHDEKDTKPTANGDVDVDLHKTEHRKKKNKNDKKKAKRVRRADSSAATSGKQTSDDNAQNEGESADSRTSQSDSVTSKPAPSSENVVTSDSSRDAVENKQELPPSVHTVVEELKCHMARLQLATPNIAFKDVDATVDPFLVRLERALSSCGTLVQKHTWTLLSRILNSTRVKLYQRAKRLAAEAATTATSQPTPPAVTTTISTTVATTTAATTTAATTTTANKRKQREEEEELDFSRLSPKERESEIAETLAKLGAIIEERKPSMIANYKAECARVHEQRKQLQAAAEGAPHAERRLPKRRFPWCPRSRALLHRLTRLAGSQAAAATLLGNRALPLFPKGFVRMPTLLRQAEVKTTGQNDLKRPRVTSASQQPPKPASPTFTEPMQFPSTLTVTTLKTEKTEPSSEPKHKTNNVKTPIESPFGSLLNTITTNKSSKQSVVKTKPKETVRPPESYVPPNSIGNITITPVNSNPKPEKTHVTKALSNSVTMSLYDKQKDSGMIRVKSPATLTKEANEIAKKDKVRQDQKEKSQTHSKDSQSKRTDTPLQIETNFQQREKPNPSPNMKKDEQNQKKSEKRPNEDKIPRPTLIPVQHSPTFAKPDKRATEPKKKKDLEIISDLDPLEDTSEPVAIDDSSSDVEVIEVKTDKSESKTQGSDVKKPSDTVPSKEPSVIQSKDSVFQSVQGKVKDRDSKKDKPVERRGEKMEVDEIDKVMRDLREMQDSQEPNYHSNGFADDIVREDRTSLSKMDGCSSSEVDVS